MNINAARERLKSAYKGIAWAKKVDGMSDNQVIAVLRRLESQGKI